MYLLYSSLLTLALPIFVTRLLVRSRRERAYRMRIAERFMCYRAATQVEIWVHAVSVGEVIAITPMITSMQALWPNKKILVTTTTPTGSRRVKALLGDSVSHVYLPYDLPVLVRWFLNGWQPKLALFVETEVWPNFLYQCHRRGIKTMLINARLSEDSFKGYKRFRALLPSIFSYFDCIAAESQASAERFLALGARQVKVAGNIKFDLNISKDTLEKAAQTPRGDELIWVAASTHPGEEVLLLDVYQKLRQQWPKLYLILVPRHPERSHAISMLAKQLGLAVGLHSQQSSFNCSQDLYIVDTLGELMYFYALADIVFVGGSLVPHGGHNLIEPCALGKPVLSGPFVKNFIDLKRTLENENAALYIRDSDSLIENMSILLADAGSRNELGQKARACVDGQRGSLERQLSLVQNVFSSIT